LHTIVRYILYSQRLPHSLQILVHNLTAQRATMRFESTS